MSLFWWKISRTKDGGKTLYYEKKFVLPWFCGLRIPIDKYWWRDIIKFGLIGFLDTVTGDELLWRICPGRLPETYGEKKGVFFVKQPRWLSILSEGNFWSLYDERCWWAEYEFYCRRDSL